MLERFDFDDDLTIAAETLIRPNEFVRWAGRPSPVRAFLLATPIWLFATPWTLFSVAWISVALAGALGGAPIEGLPRDLAWALPLFGAPFFLIGLGMLAAPLLAALQAAASGYVVTNQRIVELRVGPGMFNLQGRTKVWSPEILRGVETHRFRNGRGTVKALGRRSEDGIRSQGDMLMSRVDDPQGAEDAIWALLSDTAAPA